ncbi:MAG: cation transporter [Anaerolineae bacterium]|nr:cation transporter [Anaerolineae bacterium]
MQWIREYQPDPERRQRYTRALVITVAGNVILATGKGIVAYLSGSAALYADAANSVSDVIYSLLMVLGLWVAQQPPDLSHPQGHSRFEPLVGLMVSLAMGFAGFEAARTSIARFMSGGLAVTFGLPTFALMASAALKTWMFFAIRDIAQALASPTLEVTARDNLSDVLTSAAAFAGTLGSQLLHPLADPIAGLLVALWIFRAAFDAARENLAFLTGAGAAPELREEIAAAAHAVDGVRRVHQVIAEYVGPQLIVDLHVNVDGDISLYEAHAISDRVQEAVESLPEVDRAYIHLEPCEQHEADDAA